MPASREAASAKFRRFRVIPMEEGQTLQILLSRRLPGVDRATASQIIKAGGVYVNKLRVRLPMVRVAAGERITVYPNAHEVGEVDPAELRFVHRDPNFVVLDKPAGVPVAQTRDSAQGTLAAALRKQLEQEGARRPYVGVVHRLDRGASGLVLFTIRDIANKSLHQQFKEHRIAREYRLRVHGHLAADFVADQPLRTGGRTVHIAPANDPYAAPARTHFELIEHSGGPRDGSQPTTLLRARLETGRTHQIRAHIAHAGHPIVGDHRYGDAAQSSKARDSGSTPRLHLHAQKLRFEHPLSGDVVACEAELPSWAAARGTED